MIVVTATPDPIGMAVMPYTRTVFRGGGRVYHFYAVDPPTTEYLYRDPDTGRALIESHAFTDPQEALKWVALNIHTRSMGIT